MKLRSEVREFLAHQTFTSRCDGWLAGHDLEFSRRLAERGWVGMTFPVEYGGHGRSATERYVVVEELLAAGAPVAAHWVSDRQTGPVIMRYGTEPQKRRFLPEIAAARCFFSLGMSEPDAGSDLASIRTEAVRVDGGWKVSGRKVWTSMAHHNQYMLTLCRTAPAGDERHVGMSQLIIGLKDQGVDVRPIRLITGHHHFNEVVLDGVFVPDAMVLGQVGNGWNQVISELAYERSGPERVMSTFPLLVELASDVGASVDDRQAALIGRLVARLQALRRVSLSVATAIEHGGAPVAESALIKEIGTDFERSVGEIARLVQAAEPASDSRSRLEVLLAEAILSSPGFTLRAGTSEVLRNVVARAIGMS
jgi:alkylation response protein AidB-like acyl-CoA dehydrogenase